MARRAPKDISKPDFVGAPQADTFERLDGVDAVQLRPMRPREVRVDDRIELGGIIKPARSRK